MNDQDQANYLRVQHLCCVLACLRAWRHSSHSMNPCGSALLQQWIINCKMSCLHAIHPCVHGADSDTAPGTRCSRTSVQGAEAVVYQQAKSHMQRTESHTLEQLQFSVSQGFHYLFHLKTLVLLACVQGADAEAIASQLKTINPAGGIPGKQCTSGMHAHAPSPSQF